MSGCNCDVTSRRVEFVEVVKDAKNIQQANSAISLGMHKPPVPSKR